MVERIFRLAAAGWGLTSIAKRLNDEGAPSPRAQQGRRAGWAPSSVREVLHRPLYRGEVVWHQTRKRDAWGVKRQRPRPVSDWMRVDLPELVIVSATLWEAAHQAMAAQRARYSRTSGYGAPPWGTEARYLLTGLLRCATCGSGMEARRRRSSTGRVVFYGCAAYHRRGRSVCENALTVPMENADSAVLTELESNLLHPRALAVAIDRAVERISGPLATAEHDPTSELRSLDEEMVRLTEAIATGGGSVPALVAALQSREVRRRELQTRRRDEHRIIISPHAIRHDLEQRLTDWRSMLHDRATHARRLVKQLIVGRLDMTPKPEDRFHLF